jgi:hypothetical protein
MPDGANLILGTQNTSSSETRITRSGATPNVSSLVIANDNGPCLRGSAVNAWPGVVGESESGDGVLGTSTTVNGVRGISSQGAGVSGRCENSTSAGVFGEAIVGGGGVDLGGGTGVWGNVTGDGKGVFGRGAGTGTGVWGEALGGEGAAGVVGNAPGGGDGVWGQADGGGNGVVGLADTPGFAGIFWGNVHISGDLTTQGAKSAILRHSDGTLRRMYALESPESWFEDFGRAEVVDGRAEVELDNEFASMVHTDDYHVFLTPEGETQGLYVSARSPDGFEVREQQGGRSNLTFSYRIVAKRSDIEARRLEQIEAPSTLADIRPRQTPPEPPESPY